MQKVYSFGNVQFRKCSYRPISEMSSFGHAAAGQFRKCPVSEMPLPASFGNAHSRKCRYRPVSEMSSFGNAATGQFRKYHYQPFGDRAGQTPPATLWSPGTKPAASCLSFYEYQAINCNGAVKLIRGFKKLSPP